jgi:hypothetical protein
MDIYYNINKNILNTYEKNKNKNIIYYQIWIILIA